MLQQHGSRLLPGEPWEAGTGRLDLKVQNGTVPELQIRWGVVIWGSQFSRLSGSRLSYWLDILDYSHGVTLYEYRPW